MKPHKESLAFVFLPCISHTIWKLDIYFRKKAAFPRLKNVIWGSFHWRMCKEMEPDRDRGAVHMDVKDNWTTDAGMWGESSILRAYGVSCMLLTNVSDTFSVRLCYLTRSFCFEIWFQPFRKTSKLSFRLFFYFFRHVFQFFLMSSSSPQTTASISLPNESRREQRNNEIV